MQILINIESSTEFIAVVCRKGKHSERQWFCMIKSLRKKKNRRKINSIISINVVAVLISMVQEISLVLEKLGSHTISIT